MAGQLTSNDDVKSLGTILGVWAHPDDESFMSAGLMAMAVNNGQAVACITATKGELGVQDEARWPSATLGETRAAELDAAFGLLGIQHHHWLGYADGSCATVPDEEAINTICEYIHKYNADTIITFPPDGSTGHPDHVTVSRWTRQACERCQPNVTLYYAVDLQEQYDSYLRELDEQFNIYFNIDDPHHVPARECDILLKLTPEIAGLKCDALIAMPSQTKAIFDYVGKPRMCQALGTEGYVLAERDHNWGTPRVELQRVLPHANQVADVIDH